MFTQLNLYQKKIKSTIIEIESVRRSSLVGFFLGKRITVGRDLFSSKRNQTNTNKQRLEKKKTLRDAFSKENKLFFIMFSSCCHLVR